MERPPHTTTAADAPHPLRESTNGAAFPLLRRTLSNAIVVGAIEATALLGSLWLAGLLRTIWRGEPMFVSWMFYLLGAWLVGAYVAKLLPGWGLGPVEELRRTVLLLVTVFAGTTAMLFWGKAAGETSRLTLTIGFLLSVVLVPLVRLEAKRALLSAGRWGVPAAIYGHPDAAALIVTALREERGLGYQPLAVFVEPSAETPPPEVAGLPVRGSCNDSTLAAPVALLATSRLSPARVSEILEGPLAAYRRVVLVPDMIESPTLWVKPRDLMGMLGIEIPSNLLDPTARIIKWTVDMLITLSLAILWVPLCIVLGLLIWLEDRGHPLFLQERVGLGGRRFRTFKFRTMHPDAEDLLRRRLAESEELRGEWNRHFKLRVDPRITRIGAFLRRTSLDELPQFVNVLRSEMSLVGPRPLPHYHYQDLPERTRRLRDRVRPGITGLWQVSGRSEAGHAAMPKWDMYYVRNWSIWLDIVILIRTIRAVSSGKGAF